MNLIDQLDIRIVLFYSLSEKSIKKTKMEIYKRLIENNLDEFSDMLIRMLSYRFANIESYSDLDNIEQSIIPEEVFNEIKVEY